MRAEYQDLESLLEVQRIDLMVMSLKKQRAELPQRIQVMRIRKKRDQIQEKLDQVMELAQAAQAEAATVSEEDATLAERQARAQELIDASGTDYRNIESQSKEMAGMAKRRETLAMKMMEIEEKQGKIAAVQAQLEAGIAAAQSEEARLRADFEADDAALIDQVKSLNVRREELIATVDAQLVALYDKACERSGGVGLGKLEESTCGVCRSAIDGGRLIELRAQAPLGTCPSCKRLLVIE